jgi:hypothetical protein
MINYLHGEDTLGQISVSNVMELWCFSSFIT